MGAHRMAMRLTIISSEADHPNKGLHNFRDAEEIAFASGGGIENVFAMRVGFEDIGTGNVTHVDRVGRRGDIIRVEFVELFNVIENLGELSGERIGLGVGQF